MIQHLQPENHIPVVEEVLQEFAQQVWGNADEWRYAATPAIQESFVQSAVRAYRWLGSLLKLSAGTWIDHDRTSPTVGADQNYLVAWDFARPSLLGGYKIFTMKYYIHDPQVKSGAWYYYIVEVGKWTRPVRSELVAGLEALYDRLQVQPISIRDYGPADGYTTALGSGIELTMRTIMYVR